MAVDTLEKLLVEELRDLYDAEHQIARALKRMAKAAASPELKAAFEAHMEQTQGQIERLAEVFGLLDQKPRKKKCEAMQGLIAEAEQLLEEDADAMVRDAGLIAAAQRVEHYEMAGYGTVRTWAHSLGHAEAAELLQQTLDEESQTNQLLTRIAESVVNPQAQQDRKSVV